MVYDNFVLISTKRRHMQLIIGTTNEAKVRQIKGALSPLNLQIDGVKDKGMLPEVIEDGATAQDNTRKKAIVYAKALDKNVLSMDNALFIDGLSDEEQPGINVRRIAGQDYRPSDEELLRHYSSLIKRLGAKVKGHWEFAVCVATPNGEVQDTTIISHRIFVAEPSAHIVAGYPLESIQIEPESGKYISEMSQYEQDIFWQKAIGEKLCDFVRSL